MGKTAEDQLTLGQTDRQTRKKKTRSNDRHILWRRRVRARSGQHLSTPALRDTRSPRSPRGGGAPRDRAGLCTNYSTKGGRPRKTDAGEAGGRGS